MMLVSFLIAMAWKSAVVCAAVLALALAAGRRSPADRALVLRAGVGMLAALPSVMLLLPALEVIVFPAPGTPAPVPAGFERAVLAGDLQIPPEPAFLQVDRLLLFVYLAGFAGLCLRQLCGLLLLRRWTDRARAVDCPRWGAALETVDRRPIRLLVSDRVRSPLSWGWRRPVVLIDPATLARPEEARAILAHEAAHIARGDWPVLMLARFAVALFWFNPLAWLLQREIVQQAEEAADSDAAARVGPALYAETLLGCARRTALVPANSIAPTSGGLGRRIRKVLAGPVSHRRSATAGFAALACFGMATIVAAVKPVAAMPEAEPVLPAPPVAPRPAPAPVEPQAPAAPAPVAGGDIGRTIEQALADVPQVEAESTAPPVDVEAAIRRAREAMRRTDHVQVDVEAAMERAREAVARAEAVRRVEVAAAMRQARQAASAVANGSGGMERGAGRMEAGAEVLERKGIRLETDAAFRAREIARAAERGQTLTHADLVEAGRGLREGAQGMREGARELRQAALEMRRFRID